MLCRAPGALTPAGPGRQTDRRALLQPDHGDLGPRHSAQRLRRRLEPLRWVMFEEGHVAEYREPRRRSSGPRRTRPCCRCCATARSMPRSTGRRPAERSGLPERHSRSGGGRAGHGMPSTRWCHINHMVVTTERLSKSNPDAVREVFRLLLASKQAAGLPRPGAIDFLPFGVAACRPAFATMISYEVQQRLLPRASTWTNCLTRQPVRCSRERAAAWHHQIANFLCCFGRETGKNRTDLPGVASKTLCADFDVKMLDFTHNQRISCIVDSWRTR